MTDTSEEIQWVKDLQEENVKLKAEVKAWRDRFRCCGFDGTSIVMSG